MVGQQVGGDHPHVVPSRYHVARDVERVGGPDPRPDRARVDPQLGRFLHLAEVQDHLSAGGVGQLHFLVVLSEPAVPPQPLVDPGARLDLPRTAAELERARDAVLVRRRAALDRQHARLPFPAGDVEPARLQLGAFRRHPQPDAIDVQHVLAVDRNGELDGIRPRRDDCAEDAAPVPVVVEQGPARAVHQVPARVVEIRLGETAPRPPVRSAWDPRRRSGWSGTPAPRRWPARDRRPGDWGPRPEAA